MTIDCKIISYAVRSETLYPMVAGTPPQGEMKLEFLEDPGSMLLNILEYSTWSMRISWIFFKSTCLYWSDLRRIQGDTLGLGRINLDM